MTAKHNNAVGPQIRSKPEGPGKLVPILAIGTMVGALAAATQYFAHTFHYHPQLGPNFAHLYAPWAIVPWAAKWYDIYPNEVKGAGSIGISLAAGGLLILSVCRMALANKSMPNPFLHGSARWANKADMQKAGLLPRKRPLLSRLLGRMGPRLDSVYVGAWVDAKNRVHYLRHSGPEHVLCYAPTRSGKGVGLIIPTLLSWQASAVITDLKGELWAMTAGWRKKHANNKVLRFEPAAASGSVRWNPLDEIRLGTEYEVGDVQNLATLLVDPDGKGLESHWQKTSQALLVGVILHALYKARGDGTTATLPGVDAMLSDPERNVAELWMEMATHLHLDGLIHPVVGAAARDMLDRPDEEAGSVLSTAKSYLSLYRDPVVARNVGASEFSIKRDLMHSDTPVSLYIVTQPTDKARLRPLVRVMVNMMIRLLADKLSFEKGRPVAHYKHRLLFMGDELPSLGKLEILQEALAFIAAYGIKCYLICQDLNQLRSRETGYGPNETITANCHIQNAYPPNHIETAEHISKFTGQTTIIKEQITTSGRRLSAMLGQVSRTTQEVQRPLLTVDECLRMPGPVKDFDSSGKDVIKQGGDMVIYVSGFPAIYGRQPLYFMDPVFQARAEIPAPEETDRMRTVASAQQHAVTI